MPISEGMKKQITDALAALGLPAPFDPGALVPGPFAIGATIPDNATTAVSLRAGVAQRSDSLITGLGFSGDNPEIAMLVTGVEVKLVDPSLSAADLAALYQYMTLKYVPQGGSARYFGLGRAMSHITDQIFALDSDEATLTEFHLISDDRFIDLSAQPFVVDFSTDTFEVYMHTAQDMAAAVNCVLNFTGAAWSGSYGRPSTTKCASGGLSSKQVEQQAVQSLSFLNRQLVNRLG